MTLCRTSLWTASRGSVVFKGRSRSIAWQAANNSMASTANRKKCIPFSTYYLQRLFKQNRYTTFCWQKNELGLLIRRRTRRFSQNHKRDVVRYQFEIILHIRMSNPQNFVHNLHYGSFFLTLHSLLAILVVVSSTLFSALDIRMKHSHSCLILSIT